MSLFKPNCAIETTDKILVLEENKRVGNTNKIRKEEIPPKVTVSLPLLL